MKKTVFSKILVALLALTMVFAMVACSPEEEKETFTATAQDAADAVNAFLASAEDAASNLTKEELLAQIPSYSELMDQIALEQKKDQYFTDIKTAIDSVKGEIGQIKINANVNGQTISSGDKELLYAGIKDGQLYISAVDGFEDNAAEVAFYVCYNDDTVYAVKSEKDSDGEVNIGGVQFPYNEKYDELVEMLPAMEAQYDEMLAGVEAALDEMFAALESATASMGALKLPAIEASSFEAVEGKANTFRLTDAYLESLVMGVVLGDMTDSELMPEEMKAEMEQQISDLLSKLDVYPYFTIAEGKEIAGVGIYADVNMADLAVLLPTVGSAENTCQLNLYVGADGMECAMELNVEELGHVKCNIVANDQGMDTDIDVSINGITFVCDATATATAVNGQVTVTVPEMLTLVAKLEGTTKYDAKTGAVLSSTTKNTLSVDCKDLTAFESLFGSAEEEAYEAQPAIPFKGELTMTTTLNLGNIMAENADIFSYGYTLKANGGTGDDAFSADLSAGLSVKSEEVGAYRLAVNVDGDIGSAGQPNQEMNLDVSCRISISDAKDFPATLPENMQDFLNDMKEDPTLNSFEEWFGATGEEDEAESSFFCELCDACVSEEDCYFHWDSELGRDLILCPDCYNNIFGN